jgi:hypothetical protein
MATKLPVVETVFNTYGMVGQHGVRALTVMIGPYLLFIAIALLGYLIIGPATMSPGMDQSAGAGTLLGMLVWLLLLLLPYVMIYVGLFRLGMTGSTTGSGLLGIVWGQRETRVLLRSILLFIILFVLAIPVIIVAGLIIGGIVVALSSSDGTPSTFGVLLSSILMFLLVWVPLAYVGMRLSLYPASPAVDENISLGGSWSQTSGNGLRLVAISILVALPLYVISIVANMLFGPGVITAIVSLVIAIVGIMLNPFMISIIYKALANRTAAAPR